MHVIVPVLFAGGFFGGWINYLRADSEATPKPSSFRSIIVGPAASFLVPST
jgi:hypothetical protein